MRLRRVVTSPGFKVGIIITSHQLFRSSRVLQTDKRLTPVPQCFFYQNQIPNQVGCFPIKLPLAVLKHLKNFEIIGIICPGVAHYSENCVEDVCN